MSATRTPTFSADIEKVTELVQELSYSPNGEERRAKAKLIAALEDNPVTDWASLTSAAAVQLTGDERIARWWSKPGFAEWFCNKNEFRAKAEFLLDVMLDGLVELAASSDPRTFSSKINAIKVLVEITGRGAKSSKVKVLDTEIPTDPDELREYIAKLEGKK